eukprot:JP438133.1.p2 GENE.JP438133.1~~JP438133.1.p2  ORF type:complete len:59 (-),score=4.26 JP438133.1:135-311(-)
MHFHLVLRSAFLCPLPDFTDMCHYPGRLVILNPPIGTEWFSGLLVYLYLDKGDTGLLA